jgi:hypothetical protein
VLGTGRNAAREIYQLLPDLYDVNIHAIYRIYANDYEAPINFFFSSPII